MIKTKVAFLEGRHFSSQSEQSEKFSKSPDWLEKSRTSKKGHFRFDHVSKLIVDHSYDRVIKTLRAFYS